MPKKLSRFWQELKRRRVIHVIVVYASVAFVIIELVNNVFEPLQLPDWTPTLIIVLLIVGFPLAIVFSWIYDITSKGITRTLPYSQMDARSHRVSGTDGDHFENSIAVLPFLDMSPDQDQEYFCDGIAEEIINALTHVVSLKVIARTSSFVFKNKQVDMREIGHMLNVKNLLEGSIRLHKDQVRITAQLINAEDGAHLWSERYDRSLDDIFAIQDDISLAIVDALKVRLLGEEKVMILKRHTENLEAYRLYLRAIYFLQQSTPKGIKNAIDHLNQALERDPKFVLAYIGLALAYLGKITFGPMAPGD